MCSVTTPEDNKKIAARFYAVYNEGNTDVIDEIFSSDFVGRDPNDPSQERHGPEGYYHSHQPTTPSRCHDLTIHCGYTLQDIYPLA
jgi:hypothetical protein